MLFTAYSENLKGRNIDSTLRLNNVTEGELTIMTNILVIEDEQDIRENIIETLQLGGYDVQGAFNGERGLSLAKRLKPDLILCDIMMDGVDGFGVLDALRRDDALASTPLIFITARADRRSQRRGMVSGADDYITKPFTTGELLDAVSSRLERQQMLAHSIEADLESAKRHLFDLISQEIQGPVESLALMTNAIMTQLNQLSLTDIIDLMDAIHYGSHRLRRVTKQITLMAQLGTGLLSAQTIQADGQPIYLHDVWTAALAVAREIAGEVDVDIVIQETDPDVVVWGDIDSLRQGIAEVIANALQHSPPASKVTLSQIVTGDVVRFSVTDSGNGFVFMSLPDEIVTGKGMGLALTQRILQAHGGELRIDSNAALGTVVQISLPLSRDNASR